MSKHSFLFQSQMSLDYKQVTCHMCKKKMKMKRSKSLSPEPSSSGESKRIKYEEKRQTNGISHPHLLDFCDDILLNILKYLSPQELMALSLCSQRLAQVTRDRTLWRKVDFRTIPMSLNDIDRYTKFFQPMTTSVAMRGDLHSNKCSGLTQKFFDTLNTHCGQLKELIIEDYHIDGDKVQITDFPRTIEKLSLKGCEMGHLQSNKSYFFKIDLHMPNLTCLILSNCQWFMPHSLLVISKISKLKELRLNSCHRLGECVAYASLATRFGFKTLETLDLRDTALGDSEVSCFSSTKTLTHLYLECPSVLRNGDAGDYAESIQQQENRQHRENLPLLEPQRRRPVYVDGNIVQFLVEGNWENYGFQRCLISDRAIRAIGSIDRKVIHTSPHGIIFLEEDNQIFNNPLLKTLVVRNYPQVTNSSLVYLAEHVLSLEHLDVTGTSVTREGVQKFKLKRPNIVWLIREPITIDMATTFEILCAVIAVIVALYYYFTSTFDFWKVRGVAGPKPYPFTGNVTRPMLGKIFMGDYLQELYNQYKDEPFIGIFTRRSPVLIVKDLDFIKDVLIKDFSKFSDRGLSTVDKIEPLSQHLFSLETKRWRPLRIKLSPVFTSGKLKEMFGLIVECADHLEKYLESVAAKEEPVECRELTAKFTTDVIGSCAFGIEMNALADEDSEFRKMGRKVFSLSFLTIVKNQIRNAIPKLYNLLGYVLPPSQITRFFKGLIVDTMNYRKEHNILRHDFVNLLMELKDNPEKLKDIELTDDLIAAQAFVFFIAGFETSSSTMSHALYELALNPTIQDKLREEINEEYEKHGDVLKYDNIKEMTYLDLIFRETLRKYPPVTFLMRQTVANYTFEAIYPEPDVFKPERFTPEAISKRHPMSYLPFGDGPRNCIGARFAVFQTKVGLIKTLRKYKVEVCEKTPIPYVKHPNAFLLVPKDGLYLKLTKIN
ncbi:hypothetical protein KPH14_010725 [Odynerus spinipes]|uniref:F-box domain-containing protein n=1 Tax=Odynerus spinipes TaxID=1348599 RepID=A0AAD9RVK5_9HYME|nr:hypothetical protein KPH14_010725 [Odynerus spinipes]